MRMPTSTLFSRLLCVATLVAASAPALADTDFTRLNVLTQAEFKQLAGDLNAVTSYKAITPAAGLGVTGFDLGAELSFTQLNSSATWKKAGADVSTLVMPRLHLHKGLPFNLDVGASLVAVPDSNIKLFGAEIRYALIEGGVAVPAVAVRAAMSKLSGVSQLDVNTQSLELVVSKGFLMLTPYAGVGQVWGRVTPNVAGLRKESPSASKIFAGVNANFGVFNLAAEVDRTGDNQTASVKLGFRW